MKQVTTKDDSRLLEYALDILDRDACTDIERQLSESAELRAELASIKEALHESELVDTPLAPSTGLLDRILDSIKYASRFEGFVERLTAFLDFTPQQVRELLAKIDNVSHRPWVASKMSGARFMHFDGGPRVASADCGLVYLEPGIVYPPHQHLGDEWTFILQGGIRNSDNREYQAGDTVFQATDSIHTFEVLGDEACIFAIVLHQGLKWIKR